MDQDEDNMSTLHEGHATFRERRALARMVIAAFEHWGLDRRQQAELLGLSQHNGASIQRYRNGGAFPDRKDLLRRARLYLAIHARLRLLFPHNRDLAYGWMTARNRAFANRTPVDLILDDGFCGLLTIEAYLRRAAY